MKTGLMLLVAASLLMFSIPSQADMTARSDNLLVGPSGLANQPGVFGKGPQQYDKSLGWQNKHSVPDYGYWGVGPDYGNYEWPFLGPYAGRPKGRPMDALTYAPFPIEAARGKAALLDNKTRISISWPGGPQGVQSVDFAVLDEAGGVMVAGRDLDHPYGVVLPLPDPAQKVRITVNYTDGFSTDAFWIPW